MSWLNSVRNALSFGAKPKTTADNLWHKCKSCEQMIFSREWEENQFVCPKSGPGSACADARRPSVC